MSKKIRGVNSVDLKIAEMNILQDLHNGQRTIQRSTSNLSTAQNATLPTTGGRPPLKLAVQSKNPNLLERNRSLTQVLPSNNNFTRHAQKQTSSSKNPTVGGRQPLKPVLQSNNPNLLEKNISFSHRLPQSNNNVTRNAQKQTSSPRHSSAEQNSLQEQSVLNARSIRQNILPSFTHPSVVNDEEQPKSCAPSATNSNDMVISPVSIRGNGMHAIKSIQISKHRHRRNKESTKMTIRLMEIHEIL